MKYLNQIVQGDCLELMKELPNESIDLIVTDPPFGIAFMGKHWDKAMPSVGVWKECLRILKSGAFAFVMSLPRQDVLSRMIVNLEDAGFKTGFTSIYHVFASGFPKAENIGKMVDKKLGMSREIIGQKIRGDVEKAKQTGTTFAVAEANKNNKAIFGYGIENITVPASIKAKELNGSFAGFQPKPAVEIILTVMKPLSEKTYVEQALKNGKGITWLADCKIPLKEDVDKKDLRIINRNIRKDKDGWGFNDKVKDMPQVLKFDGRFPANLLVSDNVLDDGIIRKSGTGNKNSQKYATCFAGLKDGYPSISIGGDSGEFSRFFSLDAWWEKKVKELPESVQKVFPFLIISKASRSEKNKGLEDLEDKSRRTMGCGLTGISGDRAGINTQKPIESGASKMKNIHPTCKPFKLMSYLITLGSQENDIILDPFVGSGTTCISAKLLNRQYIGFELDNEYVNIANKRLEAYKL